MSGPGAAHGSPCCATAAAPRTSARRARGAGRAVGSQHDVRVEHREQRVEVAAAGGGEEGVDDVSLAGEIGVEDQSAPVSPTRPMHPAAGAAGELPRGVGRAPHDGGDLVEGHGEHVVQHEREPLGGSQGLEHHEQRETDRVGQQRFLLGVDCRPRGSRRLRHVRVQRLLPP